ncbi:putative membrane protein [Psychrobacillus insolitus]|uniref:Putative membrane protein n=2 Tax=Psychrobacillus insolitus TaxID=1461 RepID=A0A2W7MJS7_9BACI|nr:putative membrane protein [Psychrobacillus insolitus]
MMILTSFWSNPLVETAGYFSVVILCLIVSMVIFEIVTKYKNWEEIKSGNIAVALATGGKIFGVCNIFRYSIEKHNSFLEMVGWGLFGFTLLIIAYWLFEFLTPRFNVDKEIEKDNRSVGFISLILSVGLSFVIGASIS